MHESIWQPREEGEKQQSHQEGRNDIETLLQLSLAELLHDYINVINEKRSAITSGSRVSAANISVHNAKRCARLKPIYTY